MFVLQMAWCALEAVILCMICLTGSVLQEDDWPISDFRKNLSANEEPKEAIDEGDEGGEFGALQEVSIGGSNPLW